MKFIFTLVFFSFLFAQTPDVNTILNNTRSKYKSVSDYSADVSIEVNLNLIKIKSRSGKVYYKSPDKFKFNSDGFGILPKQVGNINPDLLLKENHTALYLKEETLGNIPVDVIRIIPMSDSTDIILTTLWIDKNNFIKKIESNSKSSGLIKINITYDNKIKFPLPSQIEIELNGGLQEDENKTKRTRISRKSIQGNVLIKYKNYRINAGIDDKIFADEQ